MLCASLLAALDPLTLDALIDDADLEDRARIEALLRETRELVALEAELAPKLELLAPSSIASSIVFSIDARFERSRDQRGEQGAFEVHARIGVDLDVLFFSHTDRFLPQPGSESARERRCLALGAFVHQLQTPLDVRGARERARALGCAWSAS